MNWEETRRNSECLPTTICAQAKKQQPQPPLQVFLQARVRYCKESMNKSESRKPRWSWEDLGELTSMYRARQRSAVVGEGVQVKTRTCGRQGISINTKTDAHQKWLHTFICFCKQQSYACYMCFKRNEHRKCRLKELRVELLSPSKDSDDFTRLHHTGVHGDCCSRTLNKRPCIAHTASASAMSVAIGTV